MRSMLKITKHWSSQTADHRPTRTFYLRLLLQLQEGYWWDPVLLGHCKCHFEYWFWSAIGHLCNVSGECKRALKHTIHKGGGCLVGSMSRSPLPFLRNGTQLLKLNFGKLFIFCRKKLEIKRKKKLILLFKILKFNFILNKAMFFKKIVLNILIL